jgi:hypothetical protein
MKKFFIQMSTNGTEEGYKDFRPEEPACVFDHIKDAKVLLSTLEKGRETWNRIAVEQEANKTRQEPRINSINNVFRIVSRKIEPPKPKIEIVDGEQFEEVIDAHGFRTMRPKPKTVYEAVR